MESIRINDALPDSLKLLLKQFGSEMGVARKVRRISQADMATRLNVARETVARMERGDPRVNLGTYVGAAWIMGLERALLSAFSPEADPVYQREARLGLAKRTHTPKAESIGDLDF